MTIAASEHSVSFWPLTSRDRGQLVVALWVGLLLVVPLALHAPLYFDDLGRSLNGSYGWSEDGRPLADFVSQLLLMGAPRTVLTSPLGLLVCLPAMAWTSWLFTRLFQHPRPWAAPLACMFLFGSPYFIENLSYSFDAPQMVLAVLLNVRGPVQISLFKTALPDFALKANLL